MITHLAQFAVVRLQPNLGNSKHRERILVTPESDRVWIVVGRLLVLCLSFGSDQFLNLVAEG
jgi:hypothetical protein